MNALVAAAAATVGAAWGAWLAGHAAAGGGAPSSRGSTRRAMWATAGGAGALLVVWSLPRADWWPASQALLLYGLLFALSAIDLRSLSVDLALVFAGMVLRLGAVAAVTPQALAPMGAGLLVGVGLFSLVGSAYHWLRGRTGLGEGDALVLGLIGCFVGWDGVFPVVLLGAVLGLAAGGAWLALERRSLTTPLPLVPFLAVGGLAVYLARAHGLRAEQLLPGWF